MASETNTPQTVAATLARGTLMLAKSSESPRSDAQRLLGFVLGRQRAWLIAHSESFLSTTQAQKFTALCDIRAGGMPIAYILGSSSFCGRDFIVSDKVLIPRPESELLVEEAVAHLHSRMDHHLPKQLFTVLDVGIGSGAIGCSIVAEVPSAALEGVDRSAAALKVAEHNARRLNVFNRCKLYLGDLAMPAGGRSYDVVVANLPYIPTADLPKPPDPVSFEPREALDGGPDGLDHYRRLLPTLAALMKPGGLALLEAAPPTMEGLMQLACLNLPGVEVVIVDDYAGLARYVRLKAPAP
ncbi:MAG: peptide chain release factor N(5)-glutamine methyltransferase [Vulcanimicrobiaceae bacterium]